jgi:hypothetical protein
MEYSFPRYLAAKKSVDDRALNARVWKCLQHELDSIQGQRPAEILEIGAGIGTMAGRFMERGLVRVARYLAMDGMSDNIAFAKGYLQDWARQKGWKSELSPNGLNLTGGRNSVLVELEAVDLDTFLQRKLGKRTWDLLVGNAFLDLFDVPLLLPKLRGLIASAGLAYFSINFDGVTVFEPAFDPVLESTILAAYHRTMDERLIDGKRSGDSQAGRHLFQNLHAAGFDILDAGSSDWVVYSQKGVYPADEAYFLHHIIHFFEESLQRSPEIASSELARWSAIRHSQVEQGLLVYIAHQMDFLARAPK